MSLNPEYLAPGTGWLSRRDARWRLAAFAVAVLAVAMLRDPRQAAIALVLAGTLAAIGQVPRHWLLPRLGMFLLTLLPFLVLMPFTVDRGERLWEQQVASVTLFVSTEGVRAAITLILKTLALVTLAITALTAAPLHVTLCAAGKLGVPRLLVQLALLAYRYTFLLLEELQRIRLALRVRGFRNATSWHAFRTVGQVSGSLLVRGADRAERVSQAMRCRGFHGTFRTLHPFRTTAADVGLLLGMSGVFGGLLAWDMLG